MSFLHTLKIEERELLRTIVKKVHLVHHPEEFCNNYEADKVISSIGPEVIEHMIKFGKDRKVDQL
tara:strand:- start:444 stop:638 length:195 start_codon:yes stop_codon:yes gene_type:complete